MYTLGQSFLTFTTDYNCKQSLETKLETQGSPLTLSEEPKTMCKHQQDWHDSKPIHILNWPKVEKHALPKTEVPLNSLVAPVKIESVESPIVTTNVVPSIKEEGIGSIEKFQDQRVCDEKCPDRNNPNSTSKMCGSGHLNFHPGKTFPVNIKKCHKKHLYENHFSCDICGICVATKRSIRDHLHSHFPTYEFGCDICGKLLPSERLLKQHMSTHSGRRYECKICLKNYATKDSLARHKIQHQPGGLPKEHLCEICGYLSDNLKDLISHISSVHLHKKRYMCDICGGGYLNSHKFTSHMATHSEEKRFICALCDRCFKRRDDVKHHITRVHPKTMGLQKEKSHCSLCEKVYNTKEGLMKHMVRHSGERKFVCDLCGKRFMHLFDLSKHKKSSIHNGK